MILMSVCIYDSAIVTLHFYCKQQNMRSHTFDDMSVKVGDDSCNKDALY